MLLFRCPSRFSVSFSLAFHAVVRLSSLQCLPAAILGVSVFSLSAWKSLLSGELLLAKVRRDFLVSPFTSIRNLSGPSPGFVSCYVSKSHDLLMHVFFTLSCHDIWICLQPPARLSSPMEYGLLLFCCLADSQCLSPWLTIIRCSINVIINKWLLFLFIWLSKFKNHSIV